MNKKRVIQELESVIDELKTKSTKVREFHAAAPLMIERETEDGIECKVSNKVIVTLIYEIAEK